MSLLKLAVSTAKELGSPQQFKKENVKRTTTQPLTDVSKIIKIIGAGKQTNHTHTPSISHSYQERRVIKKGQTLNSQRKACDFFFSW